MPMGDNLTPHSNEVLLLNKLWGLVRNLKWGREDAQELFDALLERFKSRQQHDSLDSFVMETLHSIEINYITPGWRCDSGKTVLELIRDKTITEEELKQRLSSDPDKTLDEILDEIRQQKLNQVEEKLLDEVKDVVSSVSEALQSQNDAPQLSGLKKDFLRLCQAVQKDYFQPRLTQMVSWSLMALSETGRLIQVGTGEGKSCTVAMFAAFRALKGDKVDIMSSSSVLAERDLLEWQKFYCHLKISASCNTNKAETDLKKCYESQVVYGTVEQFTGDWLKQHFHRMDIFGPRKFQCAIVDEVDSLMLDKGHHVVYLGSDMPALHHLNPLLALVWATANQYHKTGTEATVGPKQPFTKVVLENIAEGKGADECTIFKIAEDVGLLAKGSIKDQRRNLYSENPENVTTNQLAKFYKLVEARFPSCKLALYCLNDHGAVKELNPQDETEERQRVLLSDGGFCQYLYSDHESVLKATEAEIKRAILLTPCELSLDKCRIYVPSFLSKLVDSKLKVWIENAFHARTMTLGHEYIIEKHGLVPVDYSCTGVVENYMQWTDGLQQFLEMKHGAKLSNMTAITNYMSNMGLLQKYGNQIYGVSGTLGQQAETETLQKIYGGIKTCQIPTFKRRKLFEVEGMILDDEGEWIKTICDVVVEQTTATLYRGARAVLIICETINRANNLDCALRDLKPMLYISNNMDNTAIFDKELSVGAVVIATNLAGRGTDLKVSDTVNAAGGLFVIQTFLPKNARVEAQAFGRTARQGSPGSAQLIVCSSHLPEWIQSRVLLHSLRSLLDIMVNITEFDQNAFVRHLSLYERADGDDHILSFALSHLLAENSQSEIERAKELRDKQVAKGLASYTETSIREIKKKAELFTQYLDTRESLYRSSKNKPAEADVSVLNEFWGMWLLTNFHENDSIDDLKSRLGADLQTAMNKLRKRESPFSNLHHYTAFAIEQRKKGTVAESIKLYTKAIEEDRCWAAIAYYNRAFAALAQEGSCQSRTCINQAGEDLQNALKSLNFYCEQTEVTQKYARQQISEPCSAAITRFDGHATARARVMHLFKANIAEALQKVNQARAMGSNVKVEEKLIHFLIPVELHLPVLLALLLTATPSADPLSRSSRQSHSTDPLVLLQLIHSPIFDIHNELRCLESLGLTHVYTVDTQFSLGGFFRKIFNLCD
ncbi:uncharacterized protein ACBR49_019055 [Aulostomus maculatus]